MPAGVKLVLRQEGSKGILEFVRGAVATSVPLETNRGTLYLTVNQDLEAFREGIKQFRLRTRRYAYKLLSSEAPTAEAILRWEYVAETGDEDHCRYHLHAKAVIPSGDEGLRLDRLHVPTGWVLIEHVLRFLFIDLGVRPRTDDWPRLLRESEARFEEFTSKRYKVN
jgi:hypothetical protein